MSKLIETMQELMVIVEQLKDDKFLPREKAELAKDIEKGERRIVREYTKRMQQISELHGEVTIIQDFALKMGYILTPLVQSETEEDTANETPI